MSRYVARRLLISIPVLWGISVLVFAMITLAPGDPISAMIDPQSSSGLTPDQLESLRRSYGLDRPLPVQYVTWLREAVHGNLGYSYYTQRPVTERILERTGATVELVAVSLVAAIVIGLSLGLLSAMKRYSFIDHLLTTIAFGAMSVPDFFLALACIYIFSLRLDVFPTSGMQTIGTDWSLSDYLRHLALPATILALRLTAILMRFARSSFLEVLRQDYVVVAQAKGLPQRVVIVRHAAKNAVIPLITVIGLQLPLLIGGSFIIETIFAWPGMGKLLYDAIFQRDYPVVMGVTLIIGIVILLSNLAADVAYAYADPRIRYE